MQENYKNNYGKNSNDFNQVFSVDQLPVEVKAAANLIAGTRIIGWTRVRDDADLDGYFCSRMFGMAALPCFWPHLIILSPCLCAAKTAAVNAGRSQYWILTETDLKVVIMDHDTCCFPGCASSGNNVKSIPLENITDCGIDEKGAGCLNQCAADLESIHVDTASSGASSREAVGVGLAQSGDFVQKILQQRSLVKGTGTTAPAIVVPATAITATAPAFMSMEDGRGDNKNDAGKSAEERILEAKSLLEKGIITQEEFDNKRKAIIESI